MRYGSRRFRRLPGNTIIQSIASFPYFIDWVNNVVTGGFQTYGNNNNDGRFFRDSGVQNACFIPDASGNLVSTASAGMRRSSKGTPGFANVGTLGLWNRDLTQTGSWTATTMTTAHTSVGADGTANKATRITAAAANATITQTATSAVLNRTCTVFIKRITGTGQVLLTFDNFVTTTDITSQLVNGTYVKVLANQASVTNPTWGLKLVTSGDALDVDLFNISSQISGTNIDQMHYPEIVGSAFGSIFHEVPWALRTDATPLKDIIRGPYAFYWQGYNYIANVGGLFISDGLTNCQLAATNAVNFAANVNLTSNNGDWNPNGVLNKVCGSLEANGNMILGVNGHTYSGTGGQLSPTATHFVVGNNGGATVPLNGWTEKFGIAPNAKFTLATAASITT